MAHQFPRSHRLLTPSDFKAVFDQPLRSRDRWFSVLSRKTQDTQARLGLAVAKKHLRTAVSRNRVKRIIRECFRTSETPKRDFVVLATPHTNGGTNNQLRQSILQHFKRHQKSKARQARKP